MCFHSEVIVQYWIQVCTKISPVRFQWQDVDKGFELAFFLVLVASSFRKMRSKDIFEGSLFKLLYNSDCPRNMPPLASEKWGQKPWVLNPSLFWRTNCPTIWGPLLQCPAMARSSGTCRDSPTFVTSLPIPTSYLMSISRKCVAFQHLSLKSTNYHSTFICTKREHINMARPTPAAGFAPGSTNSTVFQQTVGRISEPPDRGIFLAKVVALVNSSELFDGFCVGTNIQKPTLQQKQVLNEIEFSDPSSPDLQQACHSDVLMSASQLCQLTNARKLCSLTRKLLISTGKSLTMPKATRNATPWPGLLCPQKEKHNQKHVKTHSKTTRDDLSEFHHGNLM